MRFGDLSGDEPDVDDARTFLEWWFEAEGTAEGLVDSGVYAARATALW